MQNNTLLLSESFQQAALDLYGTIFENGNDKNPSSHALANRYNGKSVIREHLDWFNVQLFFIEGSTAEPVIMFPINNRLFIVAAIDVTSPHYSNKKNPTAKNC